MKRIILFAWPVLFGFKSFSQVEGNVTDTLGKPIGGALILAVESESRFVDSVTCDTSGYFIFKKLKPGKYTFTTKSAKYTDAVNKDVLVERPYEEKQSNDIFNGVWLEIILTPLKTPK